MRTLILLILSTILCTSCNANQKTAWEEYLSNPSNKTADQVKFIEYSNETSPNLALDLNVLKQKIDSFDGASIELSMRLLNNPTKSGLSGAAISITQEHLAKVITRNPQLYLSALENTKSKECIALTNVGSEYVDRLDARVSELESRLKSLQGLKATPLNKVCQQHLLSSISSYKKLLPKTQERTPDVSSVEKYKFKKILKDNNWIVTIIDEHNKTKELSRSPVEPEVSWLNNHILLIQVNCGSPCTAFTFVNMINHKTFISQSVITYTDTYVALIEKKSDLIIKKLFGDEIIKKVNLKLSPVAVPITAIQEAKFEEGTLTVEYLKGKNFDIESSCFKIRENSSCGD